MKKVLYVFAAAVVMVACTKEWPWADKAQTGIIRSAKDGCYELFVSIDGLTDEAGKPVGESIETKAAINETDGHFTWTAGDMIDVVTTSGVYQFVAAESGAKARFVYDGDDFTGEPLSVEYPSTNSTTPAALPTAITGNTGALSSDNLRLTGNEFDGNNVNVHHKNALVRLEFHDVPTFASKLVFDGNVNDVTVTFTPLVSRGKIVVYVPVDVATTSFSVSLRDDNNNEIVSKSTTSAKSFTAGTLKVMASVAVEGWVFLFNNASSVNNAHFHKTDGYTISWDNPSEREWVSLKSLADGTTKWYILESNVTWKKSGDGVCIQMYNDDTWVSRTDCVFLYRDFVFDLSDSKIKTDYRVYYDNFSSGWSTVNAFVWGSRGFYVYWSNWDTKNANYYEEGVMGSGWCASSTQVHDAWKTPMYFYEMADGYMKQLTHVELGVDNGSNNTVFSGEQCNFTSLNHVYWKDGASGGYTRSEKRYEGVISSAWPGADISSNKIGSLYYFTFDPSYYQFGLSIVFNDGGSGDGHQTWDIHYYVDRDYKY